MRRYIFPPLQPFLLILFLLVFPLFLFLFLFGIPLAFTKLGIPPSIALLLFLLALIGSMINIPIKEIRRQPRFLDVNMVSFWGIRYFIPYESFEKTVLAINLGGAIIPILVSIYQIIRAILLLRSPSLLVEMLIGVMIVSLLCHCIAKPVTGVGIAMPALIPPVVSAIIGIMLSPSYAAPVAYVSGTMGTLVGADIMNLHVVEKLDAPVVSIGGAGTFDGIFLTGVVAVLLL